MNVKISLLRSCHILIIRSILNSQHLFLHLIRVQISGIRFLVFLLSGILFYRILLYCLSLRRKHVENRGIVRLYFLFSIFI